MCYNTFIPGGYLEDGFYSFIECVVQFKVVKVLCKCSMSQHLEMKLPMI